MKKSFRAYVGAAQYLKKEDLSDPVDTELLLVKEEKVTTPGKGTNPRLVAYCEGLAKGLVLNTANCETMAEITGTIDLTNGRMYRFNSTSILTLSTAGRKPEVFAYVNRARIPVHNHSDSQPETDTSNDTRYRFGFNP